MMPRYSLLLSRTLRWVGEKMQSPTRSNTPRITLSRIEEDRRLMNIPCYHNGIYIYRGEGAGRRSLLDMISRCVKDVRYLVTLYQQHEHCAQSLRTCDQAHATIPSHLHILTLYMFDDTWTRVLLILSTVVLRRRHGHICVSMRKRLEVSYWLLGRGLNSYWNVLYTPP